MHAFTTHYTTPSMVADHLLENAKDILAAGIDPNKATFFIQSDVVYHFELWGILSMLTPLSWLERVPTYKDQIKLWSIWKLIPMVF